MDIWIISISFVTAFLGVLAVAAITGMAKHPVDERVDNLKEARHKPKSHVHEKSVIHSDERKGMMARLGHHVAPKEGKERSESKQRLAMAGYYSDQAFYAYWGVKILLILLCPLVTFFICFSNGMPFLHSLVPVFLATGIGMFTPDLYLYWCKSKRHEQIFCGLPDALDLLVVSIEAGLGLDAAMQRVSEEFHISNRILSEELNLTCASIRMGQLRQEALHDLGQRTGVMDLKSLVAVLIQADRFGTSMAQTLRVHADDMRTRRRQRAEELAAKTTVKLIFPLVLFIFPSIFIVLGGPAALKIIDALINK